MVPPDPIAALSGWLLAPLSARQGAGERPWLVGIVGLPGCGKSTLAAALLTRCGPVRALSVSLDDFYLEAAERRQRGLELRGPPGTHDRVLLDRFLCDLDARRSPLQVPAFDREHERRLPPRLISEPPELCLFEGWFVGAPAPGYERLARRLDRLVYVDLAIEQARAARLRREATLRAAGRGGMSEAEVARFWERSLAPHFASLVLPLRERADVVVSLDGEHRITALRFRATAAP
ncbi:MAG: hypothetical protein U1A78_19540 [Polyangia bacterium]